ncbi:MAG: hypothetical protein ACMUJM_01015 [bacterium]
MKYLCIFTLIGVIGGLLLYTPQTIYAASLKGIRSSASSGYMESRSSLLGSFSTGNKEIKGSYAYGGGSRAYSGFGGSKYGARGALDGVPDISANGTSKGNVFTTTVSADTAKVGQTYDGSYSIFKGYMSFDTTSIPYNAIITSATLIIYGKEKHNDNEIEFGIGVYESNWEEPLWNIEWGAISGSEHGQISVSEFKVDGQPNEITITRPFDIIKPREITKITLVSSRTVEESQNINGDEYIVYYTSDAANPTLRPQLDVVWIGDDPSIAPSLSFTGETIELADLTKTEEFGDDEMADFKLEAAYPTLINKGDNHVIFRVRYIYPFDNFSDAPPSLSQVWVDLNYDSMDENSDGNIDSNEADFDDSGEKIDMYKTDPDSDDWTNGVIYQAEVEVVGDGVHPLVFQFVFEDSSATKARALVGNAAEIMQIAPVQANAGSKGSTCFINSVYEQMSKNYTLNQ